jgi:chromosome segregation ATPase
MKNADAKSDTQIHSLRASLDEANRALQVARSEKETEIQEVAKLRKENKELKDSLQKSKVEMEVVSNLQSALHAEENRSSNLTTTVARLESEKTEKAMLVGQRDSQMSALNSQLLSVSTELQSCRRQLVSLQQDYIHVKSTLDFEISKRKLFDTGNTEYFDDEVSIEYEYEIV